MANRKTRLNPYLNFDGTAREAMEFYKAALGGELNIMTFGTFPGAPPGYENRVMHGQLESEDMTLMAADQPPGQKGTNGDTVSISLSGDDDAKLTGYYEKLSAGGTILEPLKIQMWGDKFGMFRDRFGMQWLVNISGKK